MPPQLPVPRARVRHRRHLARAPMPPRSGESSRRCGRHRRSHPSPGC
jgi:hypothetical protein